MAMSIEGSLGVAQEKERQSDSLEVGGSRPPSRTKPWGLLTLLVISTLGNLAQFEYTTALERLLDQSHANVVSYMGKVEAIVRACNPSVQDFIPPKVRKAKVKPHVLP